MRKVDVTFDCDLPEPHEGAVQAAVSFSLNDADYEIDLCDSHRQGLRETMRSFAAFARRAEPPERSRSRTTATRRRARDMRAWAAEHWPDALSDRGRVPVQVVRAYEEAEKAGRGH